MVLFIDKIKSSQYSKVHQIKSFQRAKQTWQKPQKTDNSKLFALFDHSNFRPKTANISDKCYKYFRAALGLYFTKMFARLWIAWVLFHVEEWKFYSTVYFGHFVQAGQSSDGLKPWTCSVCTKSYTSVTLNWSFCASMFPVAARRLYFYSVYWDYTWPPC